MQGIRRHLSYANVVATMALVFAMGGSAIAANHYLITSTKQIKPRVLNSLRGRAGAKGTTGATGKEGPPGKEGAVGKEGPAGTARAYATIGTAGEVSNAKGFGAATVELAGGSLYCIKGLPFTPENVVVSSVAFSSSEIVESAKLGELGACGEGTQVTIAGYNSKNEPARGEVSVLLN